jgi:hypothetical protein
MIFGGVKPGGRMPTEPGPAALRPLRSNDGPARAL